MTQETKLTKDYLVEQLKTKSPYEIAEALKTYPNKVRRAAVKFGIKLPNKSDAQKKALSTGRAKHPTEGKEVTDETREKISESIAKSWEERPQEEREQFSKECKERWSKLPKYKKKEFFDKAAEGVRKAAKNGSKTEIYLVEELRKNGHVVEFHRKRLIPNEKLEIDIFLPQLKTIIEINGISHYEPIHGEDKLQKKIKSDQTKYGLLAGNGFCIIVVKHLVRAVSDVYHRRLLEAVLEALRKIDKKFPEKGKRIIEVQVDG